VALRAVAVAVWVALAVACALVFEDSFEAVVNALGCAVLVAVSVTDIERRIIPNGIIVPALAVALVVQTAREPSVEWVLGALAAGGFFLVLALVYPAGLGMGDVKLAAFMGAWLGWDVAIALFAGSLLLDTSLYPILFGIAILGLVWPYLMIAIALVFERLGRRPAQG